ncbi:hypothetical protein [Flaviaesturariibacter amylovorans]|uniref:Intradiol ring-cleavage dioxygenases domain-containing protein n=1 Tax=Flaviaesturariibacter amylovorans TaxID=1084520 RepID=A0ABP8GB41_9BACT
MKLPAIALLAIGLSACADPINGQTGAPRLAGGACEGCEAVLEYGSRRLRPVDTLPDFRDSGQGIRISGTVYESDGQTPAEGVVLYVYHTNGEGLYAAPATATGWARRHGAIRGWVRTGSDGRYTFYTLRPGVYPSRAAPAHIHVTLMERDGAYYWLEDYYFDDDPLLTAKERTPAAPRGGSPGVLRLQPEGALRVAERNFILRKNLPR